MLLACIRRTARSAPCHRATLRSGNALLFAGQGQSPLAVRRSFLSTRTSTKKADADDRISIWYPVLGGLVITVVGGVKYLHTLFGGTEGLQRSAIFYAVAIPRYIQFRFHMLKDSPDEVWDELHLETSKQALDIMLQLKGFYIKTGQICSSNIGNAFPKVWQDTLSVLQDQVPPKSFDTVRNIVESEMGKPLSEVFASFEEEPIGSASIGQVHRATLLDGSCVTVKVMYPEVERLFRGDVRTIKLFAQLAQPVHVPAIEEIEKQFVKEFDYVQEAEQMATIRSNLLRAGLAGVYPKRCVVPFPYPDLCSKRVLVMEELKGDKLIVALERDMEGHAERSGKTVEEFREEEKEKERKAKSEGIQLQGPSAEEFNFYIQLLNRKRQLQNARSALHNSTVGWLPGADLKEYEGKSSIPLNQAKLMDDLILIHGHEVLVDGCYNGDPHPGNILLLGVEQGRPQLGLIDYGQVRKLSDETRLQFCRLIIALADENRKEIIRLMKELGYKSEKMNEDNIYLYAKVGYDEDNDELTGGLHIQLFMEALQDKDPIETLPRELLMVSRTSTMLRGLGHALHQSRSVAKAWKPIAEKVLKDHAQK